MADASSLTAILNLLILVVALTFITRRLKIPYTIGLIIAGIFVSTSTRFILPDLSPEVFMQVLLPPILFEAAMHIDVKSLLNDADVVISYAGIGTIVTIGAVATFAYLLLNFNPLESLFLGVIIAPTDPVAVIASFVKGGVNRRLQLFVEGESLFNDGVALVGYSLLISFIEIGGGIDFGEIFRVGVVAVVGGAIVGYAGGYVFHTLIMWSDEEFAEVLLTFLLSFGVYQFANELQSSGVIATVVAGLVLSDRCKTCGGITHESYTELSAFWSFIGFIATSLAFIFIGMYTNLGILVQFFIPVLGLTVFILATRYLKMVLIARGLEKYRRKRIEGNWLKGLWWSGLRGAISVVLALGISSLPIGNADEIAALVIGVVLATNLILGLSLPWAIKRFGLADVELRSAGDASKEQASQ